MSAKFYDLKTDKRKKKSKKREKISRKKIVSL